MIETAAEFLRDNWGSIVGICGAFGIGLELSPIRLNPISWLLKKAGEIMNSDIVEKVESLEKELHDFRKENDFEQLNTIRKEIVDFSLSCQRNEHHTRDEFDRVLGRVDDYHKLLAKYKLENGKINVEVNYINKIYQECLEQHKFFEG